MIVIDSPVVRLAGENSDGLFSGHRNVQIPVEVEVGGGWVDRSFTIVGGVDREHGNFWYVYQASRADRYGFGGPVVLGRERLLEINSWLERPLHPQAFISLRRAVEWLRDNVKVEAQAVIA